MVDVTQIMLTSFFVAFSGAAAPGPLFLTVIKESVGSNARVGAFLSAGHALVEAPVVLLIAFGLLKLDPSAVQFWLGFVGGCALIGFGVLTMGSSAFTSAPSDSGGPRVKSSSLRLLALGGATSVSNPYWTIWWLTIGAANVVQALLLGPVGLAVFFVSHIAGDGVVYVSLSYLSSRSSRFLGTRGYKVLLTVTGAIMCALGVSFVLFALEPSNWAI